MGTAAGPERERPDRGPERPADGRERPDTDRERRTWKRILILGVVLSLGPVFSVLGAAFGIGLTYHRIETMPAPTPRDLSTGAWLSVGSAAIGMLVGMGGAFLIFWSLRRLRALDSPPESEPWKWR